MIQISLHIRRIDRSSLHQHLRAGRGFGDWYRGFRRPFSLHISRRVHSVRRCARHTAYDCQTSSEHVSCVMKRFTMSITYKVINPRCCEVLGNSFLILLFF